MANLKAGERRKLAIGVVTAFPPSGGTLNEYGLHLVSALSKDPRVGRVHVLADVIEHIEPPALVRHIPNVTVERCWQFDGYGAGYQVARAALREGLDGVIFNSHFRSFGQKSAASALGLLAAPALRGLGIPTVLILHNLIETVDLVANGLVQNRWLARLAMFIGTSLTRVLLYSSRVGVLLPTYAALLRRNYGRTNILHVPHGSFGETRSAPLPIPSGPRRLLAFGKFGTYKKVELLLEAAVLLRQRGFNDIEVVIAGTDSPNTPGYLESVRQRFSDVQGVSFLGYIPESDVENTLASATVIVLPYTATTGSSGVLHQIGQVGRAVVYPDIDDLAALTRAEGYRGEVFEPTCAESLADAMAKVLVDPNHRRSLELANLRASGAFTMGDVAAAYLDELDQLVPTVDVARLHTAADGQRLASIMPQRSSERP